MLHKYLEPDDQQRLLRTVGELNDVLARRDHAWIRALLLSGLRINEFSLITLGEAQAALRSKYLFIPKEHRKGKTLFNDDGTVKRVIRKNHEVFVTVPLRAALKDLVAIRFEIGGDDEVDLNSALVISRQHGAGVPMSVRSYQIRLKHWAVLAGLSPDVSPHWLRHTRAMNIMRNSESSDPRGVTQRALGHASIGSTGIYTGVLREEMEAALTKVDEVRGKRVTLAQLRKAYDSRAG